MNPYSTNPQHDALQVLTTAEDDLYKTALAFTPKNCFQNYQRELLKDKAARFIQALLDYHKTQKVKA